jgi:hypothetical protein
MGLYINGIEYNVFDSKHLLNLEINPYNKITNSKKLFSLDDYILKDINGLYLTITKEDE